MNGRDDDLKRAGDLHDAILVFDGHVDIAADFGGDANPADRDGPGAFDLAKVAQGKVSGVSLVASAPAATPTPQALAERAGQQLARHHAIEAFAARFPDRVALAHDPDMVRILREQGRLAVVSAFQNAAVLSGLEDLDPWLTRVAVVALSFIGNNAFADSARPYPFVAGGFGHGGLSALGKAAIARLNEAGVMVDISQMSAAAIGDTLAISRAPVLASHVAPRARLDAGRNLSDADLTAIASRGGLIQVAAFAPYLKPYPEAVLAKVREAWIAEGLKPPATLAEHLSVDDPRTAGWDPDRFWHFLHELHVIFDLREPIADVTDYVDTVEYVMGVVGADHVGFGSDFNHGGGVAGWRHVGESLNLTAELLRRGHGPEVIQKLWGGNFLRLWARVLDATGA